LRSEGDCVTRRTFSSRYVSTAAPLRMPSLVNLISTNLPNLLELSFLTVRALPKLSRMGFELST